MKAIKRAIWCRWFHRWHEVTAPVPAEALEYFRQHQHLTWLGSYTRTTCSACASADAMDRVLEGLRSTGRKT